MSIFCIFYHMNLIQVKYSTGIIMYVLFLLGYFLVNLLKDMICIAENHNDSPLEIKTGVMLINLYNINEFISSSLIIF